MRMADFETILRNYFLRIGPKSAKINSAKINSARINSAKINWIRVVSYKLVSYKKKRVYTCCAFEKIPKSILIEVKIKNLDF